MLAALACLGAIDSVHSSLVHETHQDRSDLLRTPGKRHRVIVTGGAGYVGSHTVHALARAGVYDLLVIDNLESGHAEAVPRGVALKVLALDDAVGVAAVLRAFKPHALIDFAAYLDVSHSQNEPEEYVRNNVQNFKHVLDAMQASGCELIIKSSTQATYGDAPREEMPLHEGYNAEGTHRFSTSNLAGGAWNGTAQSGAQIFERFLGAYTALSRREAWLQLTPSEVAMLYTLPLALALTLTLTLALTLTLTPTLTLPLTLTRWRCSTRRAPSTACQSYWTR